MRLPATINPPLPGRNGEKGLREQQKIAECLTSLDELISANGRKLDALKTHEKGLMRQFFPLGAETIPRLRFPEFSNAPEWSEYTLVDVASVDT